MYLYVRYISYMYIIYMPRKLIFEMLTLVFYRAIAEVQIVAVFNKRHALR